MFTPFKQQFTKLLSALLAGVVLLIGSGAQGAAAHVAPASEAAVEMRQSCENGLDAAQAPACLLDQQQWLADGAVAFGAATTLTQSFTPAIRGPVCKVEVRIRRNTTAGAGPLKLSVVGANNAVLDSAAILAAPPLGVSTQTFSMGCDGGVLQPGQLYRLQLSSPTSLLGTYSWLDKGLNPYPRGTGVNAGRDYTFKVYVCPQ